MGDSMRVQRSGWPHDPAGLGLAFGASSRTFGFGLFCLTAALAGCSDGDGDDGGKTPKAPTRTVQSALDAAAWQSELAGDPELKTLADGAKVDGREWLAAGVIEDASGGRTVWADYAPPEDLERQQALAVVRICATPSSCVRARGTHTAASARLTDAGGVDVAAWSVGAPALGKRLLEHNLQKGATVLTGAALDRKNPVDPAMLQLDETRVAWGKRVLLILSAYGPEVGFDTDPIAEAVDASGVFDAIEVIHYARRSDLLARLPALTPLDVVVWIGAGVIDTFSDGKPAKSIGMTLSRGVLGDELVHRDSFVVPGGKLFDQAPLGGPGLTILAGADSLTSDHMSQTGLLAQAVAEMPLRAVVGFAGPLDVASAQAGVATLLKRLTGGDTLEAAVAATDAAATAGHAGKAVIATQATMDKTQMGQWRLPPTSAKFWAGATSSGLASKATLKLFIKISPKCVEPVSGACDEASFKAGKPVASTDLTASTATFDCQATIAGPWFECTTKNDATGADFQVRGVLRGREAGASLALVLRGSADKKVRDIAVIGAGVVESADSGGGGLTLRFGGTAAASLYLDADNRCCAAVSPLLVGQKATEQISSLKILP